MQNQTLQGERYSRKMLILRYRKKNPFLRNSVTVKILKIGTPEIITITVLHLEQLDFTVQYCVQKMQTE